MKILAHIFHLGYGWGGGSVTMCLVLEALRRRGHSITLLLQRGEFDSTQTHGGCDFGITEVYSDPPLKEKRALYEDADVVMTQGEATTEAMALCSSWDKPLAHLIHDEGQLEQYKVRPAQAQLAIYNAQWVRHTAEKKGRDDNAMVLYPFIEASHYRVEEMGDAIVLVNMCAEKGGHIFWELARMMPERNFLGVYGGWGWQVIPKPMPANGEIMDHCLDPREIYRRARLIVMPSQDLGTPRMMPWTESYGRIGIEAAASGIPTLAHPTPGLVESLGEAGIFCDRYEPQQWVDAIRALDDPETYAELSAAALKRSGELGPTEQLDTLEAELERVALEWRERPDVVDRHLETSALLASETKEPVTVRALRRLGAYAKPGDMIELRPALAKDMVRRRLIELVEVDKPERVIEPAETQGIGEGVPVGAVPETAGGPGA